MTELLRQAVLLATTRPPEEQNAIALVLLDGLEADYLADQVEEDPDGALDGETDVAAYLWGGPGLEA